MLNPTEVDLVAKALAWFDSHRGEYVEDLKRWIRIPSVSDVSQAAQGAPYGPGVSAMFEEIADTAQAYGFQSRNHEGYAMSVFARDVQWPLSKDIAVLSHADVVPAGPGWLSDPFDPYEREGYVVGRGARDDKAMCVLGMFLLRFFDDERLAFSHPLRLMYGGAEETGLHDMEHYVAAHGAPYRTVVTDCAFPVNYAQKGEVVVTAALPLPEHVESIRAGVAPNAVAGEAVLALSDVDGERLRSALSGADTAGGSFEFSVEADGGVSIKAVGRSAHAAGPQDGLNAMHVLAAMLGTQECAAIIGNDAVDLLKTIDSWTVPQFGEGFGFACEDAESGRTTCNLGIVKTSEGTVQVTYDIRFAISQNAQDVVDAITAKVADAGGELTSLEVGDPYYLPRDDYQVTTLVEAYNDVFGVPAEPFAIGGGTHSRVVPDSINFGPCFPEDPELVAMGKVKPPPDFVKDGGAHGANETVSVDDFREAFPIFVIGLLRLDAALKAHE